jgi:hypothetical protein
LKGSTDSQTSSISSGQVNSLAELGAAAVMEFSALIGEGVEMVFEKAIEFGTLNKQDLPSWKY